MIAGVSTGISSAYVTGIGGLGAPGNPTVGLIVPTTETLAPFTETLVPFIDVVPQLTSKFSLLTCDCV